MTTQTTETVLIGLAELVLDEQMQPRAAMDVELIKEYAEDMVGHVSGEVHNLRGAPWPPLEIVRGKEGEWLVDGFHRVFAARKQGLQRFQASVRIGEHRDALELSLRANSEHGARRTQEDFVHALTRALADPEWASLGARPLGELLGCSHTKILRWRSKLEVQGEVPVLEARTGADGKRYSTSRKTAPWRTHRRVEVLESPEERHHNVFVECSSELEAAALHQIAETLEGEGSLCLVLPSQDSPLGTMQLALEVSRHPNLGEPRWYSAGAWVVVVFPHIDRRLLLPEQGSLGFTSLVKALGCTQFLDLRRWNGHST